MVRWILAGLSVLWVLAVGPYMAAIITDPRMDGSAVVFLLRVVLLPAALPWLAFAALAPLVRYAWRSGGVRGGAGRA